MNGRGAAPAESEKEVRPPPLSEPSTELWAHAEVEDVCPEFVTQGPGWYALFNPGLERGLDVTLVHTLKHDRCVSFTKSTVWINEILFFILLASTTVWCVCFSPDGKYLAIGFLDGTTQIHDVEERANQWYGPDGFTLHPVAH